MNSIPLVHRPSSEKWVADQGLWPAVMVGCLVLILTSTLAAGRDDEKISSEEEAFFESRIRPVLVKNCYGCHSQKTGKARGGLMLDTRESIRAGGDSGEGIVPGSMNEGTIWSAINYEDWEMPPGKPLAKNEIDDIRRWIEMGAPDPRVTKVGKIQTQITSREIARAKREFWSFRPPQKTAVPVSESDWPETSIDQFIFQKLVENGLEPSPDVDAVTFLRRLCFDLTGLPPTPEQLEWFEDRWDQNPQSAIELVVDKLMDSDRFGERWGRHWLDVARYAESTGKELNATMPHAWRYRDYVIDSFNADKPYDQFIREQLAGDLLPVETDEKWAENLVATCFLALGPKTLTEQNPRQFRADVIDEQIDTTTRVVLGLSVACARCHDHKFDPIPQTDYYAMAGIFGSTNTHFGTSSIVRNRRPSALIELPVSDPDPRGRSMSVRKLAELKEDLDEARQEYVTLLRNRRLAQRGQLFIDGKKVEQNDPRVSFNSVGRISLRIATLDRQVKSVNSEGKPATYCVGVQPAEEPINARLLIRGELSQPAQEVSRGFVRVLQSGRKKIQSDSTGRLEMAKWMTDESNPLTARVMVNRVWLHLMGEGIVATPENFGATGQSPTHPELLDHLALEFMESGWSVKHVIAEVCKSRVYRISTAVDSRSFELDPDNRWLSHANQKRLDAEVIRDAMLSVAGNLDVQRPRGSQISEIADSPRSLRPGGLTWDETVKYRSVYLPVMRDNLPRILAVFDFAEPSMVMGKRESSNTPSQALYMLNNKFVIQQSEVLARRLIRETNSSREQIRLAFRLIYGREPTPGELSSANRFYGEYEPSSRFQKSKQIEVLSVFCQALFASAEFRFVN